MNIRVDENKIIKISHDKSKKHRPVYSKTNSFRSSDIKNNIITKPSDTGDDYVKSSKKESWNNNSTLDL